MKKSKTKEQFIFDAIKIHGDKYDYTDVEYIGAKIKVKIYCKKCNMFFYQTPSNHLNKRGCLTCSGKNKKSIEIFVKDAINIHGEKYDYSLVEYINKLTKIKIICPIHGIFEQIPMNHLKGFGCSYCTGNNKKTTEEFIIKSIEVHGNKYDYSLTNYTNMSNKVKVICTIHGVFEQIARNHLNGSGCLKCAIKIKRINHINKILKNKEDGYQIMPIFNKDACKVFDEIMLKENIHIQHAMNGGEFYIKELGCWLDGYDKENNVVYEFDEKYHNNKKQKEKDEIRQQDIINYLKCKIIRIKGY